VRCRGTPPAVGYLLRCSLPLSASPPKRPPNSSATPAASGRRPTPPVGGRTPAPYWASAAPYWAAAAYWSVAPPCAIAGAATSSVRRASIAARYRALFMVLSPFYGEPALYKQAADWDRSRPPYERTIVTTLGHLHTLTPFSISHASSKQKTRMPPNLESGTQSYPPSLSP
jgi:hypothetical protein